MKSHDRFVTVGRLSTASRRHVLSLSWTLASVRNETELKQRFSYEHESLSFILYFTYGIAYACAKHRLENETYLDWIFRQEIGFYV